MKRKYRAGIVLIILIVLYAIFFCPRHYGQKVSLFSLEGDSIEAELDLYVFRNRLEFSRWGFDGFQIALGDIMRGTFTAEGEVYMLSGNSGKYAFSQDGVYSFVTRKNGGRDSGLNEIYAWADFSGGPDGLRIWFLEAGMMREYFGKDVLPLEKTGEGEG